MVLSNLLWDFQKLLIREKDYEKAVMLADRYFEMLPLTVGEVGAAGGSFDTESVTMSGVYA